MSSGLLPPISLRTLSFGAYGLPAPDRSSIPIKGRSQYITLRISIHVFQYQTINQAFARVRCGSHHQPVYGISAAASAYQCIQSGSIPDSDTSFFRTGLDERFLQLRYGCCLHAVFCTRRGGKRKASYFQHIFSKDISNAVRTTI